MSDLAPFVAAAIQDQVALGLMCENNELKTKIKELKEIKVTDRDGSVYEQSSKRNTQFMILN